MSKRILKIPVPKKNKLDTYFITGDWHDNHMSKSALKILIKMAKMLPKSKRKLIINGDFLDCPEFMGKNPEFKYWLKQKDGLELYFVPAMNRSNLWANRMLDKLQEIFPTIIFGFGNHELRVSEYRTKFCDKRYMDDFDFVKTLKLKERGIKYYNYNDWLDIGDLSITHGMYHGTTCVKKHYETACRSVIFSHVHQVECKSFTKRGNTQMAWSLPAFCNLSPEYLKGRENNWSIGFGVINMKSNGHYNFNVFTIWDDELILPTGEVLK